jgi:membrane-bound serine protease (ClpP class)
MKSCWLFPNVLSGYVVLILFSIFTQNAFAIDNMMQPISSLLLNPNIVYTLLLFGIYGIYLEFYYLGIGFGVMGVICLLLTLFALQSLPFNVIGLSLILIGISFMIGEIIISFFRAFTIVGIITFLIGSWLLFQPTSVPVAYPLIITFGMINVLLFGWVSKKFSSLNKKIPITGAQNMIGEIGECLSITDPFCNIVVRGEIWRAYSSQPLAIKQRVKVINIQGLILEVEPFNLYTGEIK